MSSFKDLKGQTFGKLKVLETASQTKYKQYNWKCLCECGKETVVLSANLVQGYTQSCGCLGIASRIKPGAAFRQVLKHYKSSAKTRNIGWDLTDEQFRYLVTQPCYYTGRIPSVIEVSKSGEIFVHGGIDRLDSHQGYTLDNCVPCCAVVNYAKRSLSYDDFLQLAEEIVNARRNHPKVI